MSEQVVRIESFGKGSLSGIGNETERANIEHRNEDINREQSELNHYFKRTEHGFYTEWNDIKTALNVHGKETKDSIAFEGMVITSDTAFFEKLGWVKGKPTPPEVMKWAEESYKWALSQVGYLGTDKNILHASLHVDEKTPHLQLYYLPVTEQWKEKVYQKDENGKVLRSPKGTPLQAKDENGKTIYNDVTDTVSPKLSRSEFWRVRGGNTSYSRMQDSYNEKVGRAYGLGRGERGSNREHKTKAQYEAQQLKKEKQEIRKELEPYRKLTVSTKQVKEVGKSALGQTIIKTSELEKLKEQATAYTVNREEIVEIRKRRKAVAEREQSADERERTLDERENQIDEMHLEVAEMYDRQRNINAILEQAESENRELKHRVEAQEREISTLRGKISDLTANFTSQVNSLTEKLRGACESLCNAVKAIKLFSHDIPPEYKHTINDGYKLEMPERNNLLIKALVSYSAHWAREYGCDDLAKSVVSEVGKSKGIQSHLIEVDPREAPPAPPKPRNRGFEIGD